jgi:hypothetical protein
MRTSVLVSIVLAASSAAPGAAQAARITVSDHAHVDLHGYLQPSAGASLDVDSGDVLTDMYIRRARLLVSGQVNPEVSFFLGTLSANMGAGGDLSPRELVADAWVNYRVHRSLQLTAGSFLVPFSRHMQQSGMKLHGVDFHGALLKRDGTLYTLRDFGVQARGLLLSDRLDYRVALLDGVTGEEATTDAPRVVARVAVNLADAEPELHLAGTQLGKRTVISVGVSADVEPGQAADGEGLYWALAADALVDIPVGENALVFTAAGYHYGSGGALMPAGTGAWADLGYRIGSWEPIVAAELYAPREGDAGRRLAPMGGLNWWIDGHAANLKLQVGAVQLDGADSWAPQAVLQSQVAF